jgi:hypothetical protein
MKIKIGDILFNKYEVTLVRFDKCFTQFRIIGTSLYFSKTDEELCNIFNDNKGDLL